MRPPAAGLAVLAVALLPIAGHGRAQEPVDPLAGARSAALERGTQARVEPSEDADMRGLIQPHTRFPVGEVRRTEDRCRYWMRVGVDAWVCGASLAPSRQPPGGQSYPRVPDGRVLPYRYGKVGRDGARGWPSPEEWGQGEPARVYRRGFMFVATLLRPRNGLHLVRLRDGNYVSRDELNIYGESRFQGIELDAGSHLDRIAWAAPTYRRGHATVAEVRDRPGGRVIRRLSNLERVEITGESEPGWLALADGGVVDASEMRRAAVSAPPDGVGAQERWIDVDRASQTLVAYEGTTPIYATIISSGQPRQDRETRAGTFRIRIKIATATMDDIGNEDESDDYSVEQVPWVQYFDGDIALHGAFWHQSFGRPVSHGCVNLAPLDARYVFELTSPALPVGWATVRPSAGDPATIVRVR